jgi:putative transcriptional regulator
MYKAIAIDRNNLTLMGVQFSDLKTLENTANAIGSNMFEGFEPTPEGITLIRDYVIGKITFAEFIKFAKAKTYV